MLKKSLCIALCCAAVLGVFSGCVGDGKQSRKNGTTIVISYSDKKYGSRWIQSISSAFMAAHKDITIQLRPDNTIDQKAGSLLETYKGVPDIMFLQKTNWQSWASKGYLADLTGLYGEETDKGKTLESKVKADVLPNCRLNGKYYTVPWDDGVTGFIYNIDMFKANNWTVPATFADLENLMPQIKAAGIAPIAWDGKDINDWDYAVKCWCAQKKGLSGVSEYLKMESPLVYRQQSRVDALSMYMKLVSDKTAGIDDAFNSDGAKAMKQFFGSKAAMILGGSWLESMAGSVVPGGFKMGIMNFPSMSGALDKNINISPAGGFAVISAASENIAAAKEFLKFMSTDEMLELYTKITSSPRPFYYGAENIKGLSEFGKNVIDLWRKSEVVYMLSDNPIYYGAFSDWPKDGAPYALLYLGQTTPQATVEDNYQYAAVNWNEAKSNLK